MSTHDLGKISIDKLKVFYQVYREGSISKASKILGKTRHALYYDLAFLEEAMDTKLYYGGKKTFILTEEGKAFAEFCKETLNKLNILVNAPEEEFIGDLIIHTTTGIGLYYFPKILSIFKRRYPDINVKILLGPEYLNPSLHNFDLMVGPFLRNRTDLTQTLLRNYDYGFFASEGYIKKNGKPISLKDFYNHHLLFFTGESHLSPSLVNSAKSLIESNSFPALHQMCINGIGIGSFVSTLQQKIKDKLNEENRLVRILPELISESIPIYASSFKLTEKEKIIREIIDIIKIVVEEDIYVD